MQREIGTFGEKLIHLEKEWLIQREIGSLMEKLVHLDRGWFIQRKIGTFREIGSFREKMVILEKYWLMTSQYCLDIDDVTVSPRSILPLVSITALPANHFLPSAFTPYKTIDINTVLGNVLTFHYSSRVMR